MQTTATNTNTANFNGQTSFQNPPRGVTSTNSPTGPSNNRYSQPPNKGLGKKTSKHYPNYTQPSTSAIFTQPSLYPQSRNLGTGWPKMFCTACGEYNHWRKDCPYNCHCDNCDSDSHATHMCRAPPKPSPNPSPQPLICIYCGSSDHRSMECSNHPRDNREEGHAPSPVPSQYNCKKQQKSALASGKYSQKPNGKLKNKDKPRTSGKNSQNTEAGKQYYQQQQHPTQGRQNQNSFPYKDYRYHEHQNPHLTLPHNPLFVFTVVARRIVHFNPSLQWWLSSVWTMARWHGSGHQNQWMWPKNRVDQEIHWCCKKCHHNGTSRDIWWWSN